MPSSNLSNVADERFGCKISREEVAMFGLKTRRSNLIASYLIGALVLTALLALMFWLLLGSRGNSVMLLLSWLLGINVAAFIHYGYDKWRARLGSKRVPEFVLHSLTVLGGSIGAYIGMQWFRHKTIKGPFRILFWAIVALQLTIIAVIIRFAIWD